jgi:O-acetyl-ADP-ribose deacetylase (regulator of RNase III)
MNLPTNVSVVNGDLLLCKEDILCHQTNCVTTKAAHLSASVFERFPHADIYAKRTGGKRDVPGTIVACGTIGGADRLVVNLLAQFYPGTARFANDTRALRLEWFQMCLDKLAEYVTTNNVQSIAFPWNIGCGAAGGVWNNYLDIICKFAKQLPNARITLYKLI